SPAHAARVHRPHGAARGGVPGHQELRVLAQVPRAPRPRAALRVGRPRGAPGGDLLLALLRADRAPRPPHGHRARHHGLALLDGVVGSRQLRLPRAGRDLRALLALRRHRLDLPLSPPLPDRPPLRIACPPSTSSPSASTWSSSSRWSPSPASPPSWRSSTSGR